MFRTAFFRRAMALLLILSLALTGFALAEEDTAADMAVETAESDETEALSADLSADTAESAGETRESAEAEPTPTPAKKKNGAIVIELNYRNDAGRLVAVDLVQVGGVESIVRFASGEEQAVPTARLLWDTNADEPQRVAYIYAKSADKVTMRLSRAGKSKILQRVPCGKIAFVFDYHSDYTGIICNGTSGYVKTSQLKFLDRQVTDIPSGRLNYNGKLESKTKLKLRAAGNQGGKVLVSLPAGTRVVIRRVTGEFAEIEALDWHGYVQTRFITMDEGMTMPTVAPVATAAPAAV